MSLALREGAHRRSCGATAREGGRGAEKAADPPDAGRVCDRPTCPPASRSRTSSSRRQGSWLLPSQLREPQLVLRHAKTPLCWMLAPGTGRLRPGLPRFLETARPPAHSRARSLRGGLWDEEIRVPVHRPLRRQGGPRLPMAQRSEATKGPPRARGQQARLGGCWRPRGSEAAVLPSLRGRRTQQDTPVLS